MSIATGLLEVIQFITFDFVCYFHSDVFQIFFILVLVIFHELHSENVFSLVNRVLECAENNTDTYNVHFVIVSESKDFKISLGEAGSVTVLPGSGTEPRLSGAEQKGRNLYTTCFPKFCLIY